MSTSSGTTSRPPLSRFTSTAYSSSPVSAATAASPEGPKGQMERQSSWSLPRSDLTRSPEPMSAMGADGDGPGGGQEHILSHSSFLQDAPYLVDHLSYGSPPASISSEWPSLHRFDRANELMADIDALMAAADNMRAQADGPGGVEVNLSQRPLPEGLLGQEEDGHASLEEKKGRMSVEARDSQDKDDPLLPVDSLVPSISPSPHTPDKDYPETAHQLPIALLSNEGQGESPSGKSGGRVPIVKDRDSLCGHEDDALVPTLEPGEGHLLPPPGWKNDLTPIHSIPSSKHTSPYPPTKVNLQNDSFTERVTLEHPVLPPSSSSPRLEPSLPRPTPSPLIPDVWEFTGMTPFHLGPDASEDEAEAIRQRREALPRIRSLPERTSQRELEMALERLKARVIDLEGERDEYLDRLQSLGQDMLQTINGPEGGDEADITTRMAKTLSKLLTAESEIAHHGKEREELLGKMDDLRHHLEMAEQYLGEADEDIQRGKVALEEERARVERWKGRCKALVESIKHRDAELTRREERVERREARMKRRGAARDPSSQEGESQEMERLKERCKLLERQAEYAGFKLQAIQQQCEAERQSRRGSEKISGKDISKEGKENEEKEKDKDEDEDEDEDDPSRAAPQTFLLNNYPLSQKDMGSQVVGEGGIGRLSEDQKGEGHVNQASSQFPTPLTSGNPMQGEGEEVEKGISPLSLQSSSFGKAMMTTKVTTKENVGIQTDIPFLITPSSEKEPSQLGGEHEALEEGEITDEIIRFPDLRGYPLYGPQGQGDNGIETPIRHLRPIGRASSRQMGRETHSGPNLIHPRPFRVSGTGLGNGRDRVSFSISENLRRVSDLLEQERAVRSGRSTKGSSGARSGQAHSPPLKDRISGCTVCGSELVPVSQSQHPEPSSKGDGEGPTGLEKAVILLEEEFEEMRNHYQSILSKYEHLVSPPHPVGQGGGEGNQGHDPAHPSVKAERKGLALKLYGLLEGLERKGEQIMTVRQGLSSLTGPGHGGRTGYEKREAMGLGTPSPQRSGARPSHTSQLLSSALGASGRSGLVGVHGSAGTMGGHGLVAGVAGIRRRIGIELLRTAKAVQVAYREG